jgi:hypothetical protein
VNTCSRCTKPEHGRDGLCRGCRIKSFVKTKYPFTPDLDRRLTKAYREHGLTGKILALNDLVRITGYPRFVFRNRASNMGLRTRQYKLWTEAEVAYITAMAGERSARAIAEHLGRPKGAVVWKLNELGMSAAQTNGYTRCALAQLFGVKQHVVDKWIARGWMFFHEADQRVPFSSVERFVWKHMEEYRLASCEEWWLKTMLKPSIGCSGLAQGSRQPKREESLVA